MLPKNFISDLVVSEDYKVYRVKVYYTLQMVNDCNMPVFDHLIKSYDNYKKTVGIKLQKPGEYITLGGKGYKIIGINLEFEKVA